MLILLSCGHPLSLKPCFFWASTAIKHLCIKAMAKPVGSWMGVSSGCSHGSVERVIVVLWQAKRQLTSRNQKHAVWAWESSVYNNSIARLACKCLFRQIHWLRWQNNTCCFRWSYPQFRLQWQGMTASPISNLIHLFYRQLILLLVYIACMVIPSSMTSTPRIDNHTYNIDY